MKSVVLTSYGDPATSLEHRELPEPEKPGISQVLVGIEFSPINFSDILVARGLYPLQMAKAQGAKHAMSTTTNHAKAQQARSLGFDEVIDLSVEKLSDGVRRITQGYGADIVIDAIGGEVLSEALGTLAPGGSLTTLGYSAGRKATIDVTDLIWKRASMKSFSLFAQPADVWSTAWSVIFPLLQSGAVKPIVAKTFPLAEAADALRYLVEGRPFGRVVLTI